MRANDVKAGFSVDGVRVAEVIRINHLRKIVFVDGSHTVVHQFHTFADVAVSLARMPAGPVRSGHIAAPRDVRASDRAWRGETDGKRGDRIVAKINAYDLTRNGATRYPR